MFPALIHRLLPATTVDRYLVAVVLPGLAAFAVLASGLPPAAQLGWAFAGCALLAVLGELLPIVVPRREDEVTSSTSVVLAILLLFGLPAAVVAQAFASVVADAHLRKQPLAVAFNVAQYTLSLGAAAGAMALAGDAPPLAGGSLGVADLPVVALGGAVWFAVNNVLAGAAFALSTRAPVVAFLRADLAFQAGTACLLIGYAPVVTALTQAHADLLPFLAIPLLAMWRGGKAALLSDHQALHDGLTGLPNRTLFADRTAQAIALARRNGRAVAVLFVDLDRFKEVNDTLGHHHGDVLLREVGARLERSLRASDTVARLGGDEYAVLLRDVTEADDAVVVARKLLAVLREPFELGGVQLDVGASIGIAAYPQHGEDGAVLMRRADVAMYAAKRARTGVEAYAPEKDDFSLDRLAMAGELRAALERDELVLHFQPQIDPATGALPAVEALVRWEHPERGLLAPGAFVPVAEHTGLIRPLTRHVLRLAVRQAAAWQAAGRPLRVAVNISAHDLLDEHLPAAVAELLAEHGVPPDLLSLEVTESELMTDPERALAVLHALSDQGLRLAVDDFGTGHSSLAYLRRLPLHEVKVDRSFVTHMATHDDDAVIVRSTIELAHGLGLETVAEGVEDDEVRRRLAELGCTLAQGFGICRPVPVPALDAWREAREAVAA